MSLGPLMVDLEGLKLTAVEREMLCHPLVGAVILFSRNYHDVAQLSALVDEIHALRTPRLLVAVDHEGGRVQRFREGFTQLPAAGTYAQLLDGERHRALDLALRSGWVMATELRAAGIDFSFAPVLDLNRGISSVIGDRAFHSNPQKVALLASAYMAGMHRAGMAATGKHFPGHGAVAADSHHAIAVDNRQYEDIYEEDIVPFERLIENGLAGIMPAHVIYPQVDSNAAGFSKIWLQEVLRNRLRFQGVVFSDDLNMEGASVAGGYPERAEQALSAGCDMVLICNNRDAAGEILDHLAVESDPLRLARFARMHGRHPIERQELEQDPYWLESVEALSALTSEQTQELDLE